jgi:hypothetical protein
MMFCQLIIHTLLTISVIFPQRTWDKRTNKSVYRSQVFNLTFRYFEVVLWINNPDFGNWIPFIYSKEIEIKETTETTSSASFRDIYLKFDANGQLSTRLYDKTDDLILSLYIFHT